MSIIRINNGSLSASVITYGATLQKLLFDGSDIVCGYDTEEEYSKGSCYYGATVGRVCNRTPNGIVRVGEKEYRATLNEPHNSLHGGKNGFSHREWSVESVGDASVTLSLVSKDGDEGYPAEVKAFVTYTLDGDTLKIEMYGYPDGRTPICITNHSYFNLCGVDSGIDVLQTRIKLDATEFSLINENMNVVGRASTLGTPMDFSSFCKIGERIGDSFSQLRLAGGYDHNYFLKGSAFAESENIGMEFNTDMPCIQFYSGNFCTEGEMQKYGVAGRKYCGFCFEPQFEPGFASLGEHIFSPDLPFKSVSTYRFYKKH